VTNTELIFSPGRYSCRFIAQDAPPKLPGFRFPFIPDAAANITVKANGDE
jgi:hypothetical protein